MELLDRNINCIIIQDKLLYNRRNGYIRGLEQSTLIKIYNVKC